MSSNITIAITTLTLVSNVIFVLGLLAIIFDKKIRKIVYDFVDKNILSLLLVTSLGALVGSLAYSNIVGFPPCELCWVQRIFIYPQALISFVAIVKKDKSVIDYLFPMSILGALVAFYHSLVHWGVSPGGLGCVAVGGECAKVYVFEYGYITIPFMSLTAFIYLLSLIVVYYLAKKEKNG